MKSKRPRLFCMRASRSCWRGRGIWTNLWRRARTFPKAPSSFIKLLRKWTSRAANSYDYFGTLSHPMHTLITISTGFHGPFDHQCRSVLFPCIQGDSHGAWLQFSVVFNPFANQMLAFGFRGCSSVGWQLHSKTMSDGICPYLEPLQSMNKPKEKNKKVGSYVIRMEQCLGRGGFASAYRAYKDKNYSQPYAVKIIQKQDIQKLLQSEAGYFIKRVQEEYKALQNLKHPNIVQFFNVEQTGNNLYLFFEYCDQDLEKYIREHQFDRREEDIINFTKQIISACSYFTAKGFLHRDIKPANILLKDKQIKIADFGLATQINDIEKSVTFAGTPHYMAPEILRGASVKMKAIGKCDVWSVGVTLYELATGELPFGLIKKDLSQQRIIERIESKSFQIKVNGFPVIQKILKSMLVADPEERASFLEIEKEMMVEMGTKQ